jgi:hypothetical protein
MSADQDIQDIHDIRLEFLRAGPAHNHLLSPLTPYMALCGADGPVSVSLPFEHAQLINRLNRLRYDIDGVAVAASQREAELQELGIAIARVLADIPALVSELHSARADTSRLVNIRMVVSAYELGLVPFEATMAPADTTGSGAPLLLRTLTTMTREIRRGQPLKLEWNRAPKILFAFASLPGLPAVPAQAHLEALRRAIDPWIRIKDKPDERIAEVRKMLTVLKDASARKISDACQADDYTHVHILAHGAPMPGSENRRFGIALSNDTGAHGYTVVDGQSLAMALKGLTSNGLAKKPPTVVTLATCDSGNAATVLTPGGSIAHELHAQDIPWVIASQFPLWMQASNIAVEMLYRGLLAGNDPRWVLHELRQRLRIDLPHTHDWASIVAYATIAPDLQGQVDAFRSRQTKSKMEVKFSRMDQLVGANEPDPAKRAARDTDVVKTELESLCKSIRADLAAWCDEPIAQRYAKEKAERLGMSASSEKRIAIVYALFNDTDQRNAAYRKSREFYLDALKLDPVNHWVTTQFLSMAASPALADSDSKIAGLGKEYDSWWVVARQLAQWQLRSAKDLDRAWAHGTLAELELLGALYGGKAFNLNSARNSIVDHCRSIRELSAQDPFPVSSTQRQFRRYLDHWSRKQWDVLAQAALDALDRDKAAGATRTTTTRKRR